MKAKTIKQIMREMGRKGGKTAAANMTAEERLARSRKANEAKRKAREK